MGLVGRVGGAAVALGTAAFACGVAQTRDFQLRTALVPVLPVGAPMLRVLHLSDLHLLPGQSQKMRWVADLAGLEPDLVVNTGDNLGHRHAVPPVLASLGPLAQFPGVFVLGSNDYFAPRIPKPWKYLVQQGSGAPRQAPKKRLPTGKLLAGFADFGWLAATNRRLSLTVAGQRVDVVGVDDPHLGLDRYQEVSAPAAGGGVVTFGLLHAPYRRVIDPMVQDRCDVLFAGHTHGGQVCLPGGRAVVTNCDLPTQFAKGLHRWPSGGGHQSWLHVTGGLGTAPMAPVRFFCQPEATLLTLVPRNYDAS